MSKVWVLQHIECENLGTIAHSLQSAGISAQYVCTFEGQPVPKEMGDAAGLIVMGGPMGVYDQPRYPFLMDEMRLIAQALQEEKPVLGVCLGSQLLAATLGDTLAGLDSLMGRIEGNPSVVDRLDDTGVLQHQAALDLAVAGVAARASGVDRDARRDHPHGAFADPGRPDLRVVTVSEGDAMARVTVRALEARESIRLVGEFVRQLEPGPLQVALAEPLPGGRIGISAIESARGEAVHWLRTDALGRVERYHLRSPSYHNWPAVALAAETAIVPDFPLVNKSFELCYSCTDR